MTAPPPEIVVWHDAECGAYAADLPVWRELAAEAGGPVLDVGAGTGRVALDLARAGHEVTALDVEPLLLAELERRARGVPVATVAADAREMALDRRFTLVLVPMQTLQILGGPEGRRAFLSAARDHLEPGGVLAAAIAGPLPTFEAQAPADLPLPDTAQHAGHAYFSQPVAVRDGAGGGTVIERRRTVVSPSGERRESDDRIRLDPLDAATAAAEARALGYDPLEPREIAPTHEHVGSTVVVLRRRPEGHST
ncbi:MAG TPA: class I SAM-dependent methyltransferase [Solirubrobacteraceae bacterium]|nr:class I SAM-dependent methyltransferase [Solirubrobacteraceae bacterium]